MRRTSLPRQRGVIAILCCAMALGMLTMVGLALDLAMVYNRKAELQGLADAAALAAARELNGTSTGISNALTAANNVATSFRYRYNRQAVSWSSAALRFAASATTADSAWADSAGAQATPLSMMYAKVDTSALAGDAGLVSTVFIRVADNGRRSVITAARAVAGRVSTQVLPLAICALSTSPAAARLNVSGNTAYNELVEFGFRRGVAYDLMNLNPAGTAPENFLIDPLAPPGISGAQAHFATDVVGPFVCNGQLPMPTVMGAGLTLQRGFPLTVLKDHLNSRFDDYSGNACSPEAAPPDSNVKPYLNSAISWMSPTAAVQTAGTWQTGAKLWTRADPLPGDASNSASLYGPLWSFARAVPYANYNAQPVEPANGYPGFAPTAWSRLYTPNPPAPSAYPAASLTSTPYLQLNDSNYAKSPTSHPPGIAKRRVLNVALLACPVAAGAMASASVVGIGRFFMTVPATGSVLSAEFAGTATPGSLSGTVELQR
jgi:Flp pilus assembly protein TadG